MRKKERNAWDRAVAAEKRWCKKLGLDFKAPDPKWRSDSYSKGELFELGHGRSSLATYLVTRTGKVSRQQDGGIWIHE